MAIEDRRDRKYWTHGEPRKKPWLYRDRASGVTLAFKTKDEAKEYQETTNDRKRRTGLGLPGTIKDLKRYTARDIIRSYLANRPVTKDEKDEDIREESTFADNDVLVLLMFSCRDICSKNLFDFDAQVAQQYIEDRLKETTKPYRSYKEPQQLRPSSVRRERTKIQQAWQWAKRHIPDLKHLDNPWKDMPPIEGSTNAPPSRELREGELEKLLEGCKEHCSGLNLYYFPLAIYLAIETGMRLGEIFNLSWKDIDFNRRRITIQKSKTNKYPVDIVLPLIPQIFLQTLALSLAHDGRLPGPDRLLTNHKPGSLPNPEERIFGKLTEEGFAQQFRKVKKQVGLKDITFRSTLRTTANMKFDDADLTEKECDVMLRHGPKTMNAKHYTDRERKLHKIQDKLDRYLLKGNTLEELVSRGIPEEQVIQLRAFVDAIKTNPPI